MGIVRIVYGFWFLMNLERCSFLIWVSKWPDVYISRLHKCQTSLESPTFELHVTHTIKNINQT